MSLSKNFIAFFILYFIGSLVYADAILNKNVSSQNRSAIQSSSINIKTTSQTDSSYYNFSYSSAIQEIELKIKKNPEDYGLYVSLVRLYVKSNQYEKAIDELIFLQQLNKQGKVNTKVKSDLKSLNDSIKSRLKYSKNKVPMYLCLSLVSLINDNQTEAESFIEKVAYESTHPEIIAKVMPLVYNSTEKIRTAIDICDKIISKNVKSVPIKKLKAEYLCEIQDFDSAINEYKNVIELNPIDKDTKYKLYKLLVSKGFKEKDIVGLLYSKNATKLDIAFYEIADLLLVNEDVEGAEYFSTLLAKNFPDNPNGYILLAEIYRKQGKLKESYEALSILRNKANTNDDIAKYNVLLAKLSDKPVNEANSLIANGLYQQAIDLLSTANQDALYVILTQARANYFLGNKQTTLELLNKAMSFYPDNSDVYCAFGYIYLKENDTESARKYTNKSLEINQKNKTALDLLNLINKADADKYKSQIVSSYELQNYSEAMRLINEAISINNNDAFLFYYRGLTHIALNNYAASTADFYKCIDLDKNYYLGYFYLAIVFDNLSEPDNALINYKKFLTKVPKDAYDESERINYAQTRIKQLKG